MSWFYTECDGLGFYQCSALNNPGVTQAFSVRSAGNMALHTGDDPDAVIQNRRAFLNCIGLKPEYLVAGLQTHSINIQVVERPMVGNGALSFTDAVPDTDALITSHPGVILSVFTADCLPIFVYDPATPAIGIIHAGWRGTIAGIVPLTIRKMGEAFGTKPDDCVVALGPGIRRECFRVDPELAGRFSKLDPEAILKDKDDYTVDLYCFNRNLLIGCGIPECRIFDGNLCTACHPDNFFSYRASGGANGRMMGVLSLNSFESQIS